MPSSTNPATQEQQEIYDYEAFDMVITSPAGCGKTEALAYRAKGLLERFDFSGNGRKLLIVAFTNQARDNINERLAKYISVQALKRHVTVCNFHGLASRIIKAHGNLVGIDDTWEVASFDWTRKVVQTLICDKETRTQVENALRTAKLTCLSDDGVMEALQAESGQIGRLATSIEYSRRERKIVTYDDQIRTALWILQDERVARVYENHFFAALVDEFQDLTPQQLKLVKALCGNNISYAGDLAQSIFSFAGADASFTYREISKSCGKQVKLIKSFRSAPAVLDAVNSLSTLTDSENLSTAMPFHWGDGGLSGYSCFRSEEDEAGWVVAMSQAILWHCPNQRVGIVTRTGFRSNAIKHILASEKIGYTDWGNGLFRPEVAKTLRNICDDMEGKSFDGELEIYRYIMQQAAQAQGGSPEELEEASAWLFDQILQHKNGLSVIPEIRRCIAERKGNENMATRVGIHCLTGHAGKGQQFDWVFIVGLEQGSIPFYKAGTKEELKEEARILSVMISRARIGFVATSTLISPYNYSREPSKFLPYLQKNPGFLNNKDQIKEWCAAADWATISQM